MSNSSSMLRFSKFFRNFPFRYFLQKRRESWLTSGTATGCLRRRHVIRNFRKRVEIPVVLIFLVISRRALLVVTQRPPDYATRAHYVTSFASNLFYYRRAEKCFVCFDRWENKYGNFLKKIFLKFKIEKFALNSRQWGIKKIEKRFHEILLCDNSEAWLANLVSISYFVIAWRGSAR